MKRAINKWVISIFAITMLLMIGIGGKMYMDNDKKKYDAQQMSEIVEMEKIAAKQIKNTFLEIEEIKFLNNYSENKITGFTIVDVQVTTIYGKTSNFDISMSLNNNTNDKYSGSGENPKLQEGRTEGRVKIFYSNGNQEEL